MLSYSLPLSSYDSQDFYQLIEKRVKTFPFIPPEYAVTLCNGFYIAVCLGQIYILRSM